MTWIQNSCLESRFVELHKKYRSHDVISLSMNWNEMNITITWYKFDLEILNMFSFIPDFRWMGYDCRSLCWWSYKYESLFGSSQCQRRIRGKMHKFILKKPTNFNIHFLDRKEDWNSRLLNTLLIPTGMELWFVMILVLSDFLKKLISRTLSDPFACQVTQMSMINLPDLT